MKKELKERNKLAIVDLVILSIETLLIIITISLYIADVALLKYAKGDGFRMGPFFITIMFLIFPNAWIYLAGFILTLIIAIYGIKENAHTILYILTLIGAIIFPILSIICLSIIISKINVICKISVLAMQEFLFIYIFKSWYIGKFMPLIQYAFMLLFFVYSLI